MKQKNQLLVFLVIFVLPLSAGLFGYFFPALTGALIRVGISLSPILFLIPFTLKLRRKSS